MKTDIQTSIINKNLFLWKKYGAVLVVLLCTLSSASAQNNDTNKNTNEPQYRGDNFSLGGALTLFKQAKSVEQFEHLLNDQSTNVNNLDLNNDGKIDYISVNDIKENNAHILVLSTYVTKDISQDIATINIERDGDQQADIQIIGDPDLYPTNSISEPTDYNGAMANTSDATSNNRNTTNASYNQNAVNVWGWPIVQYMYNPYYSVWNSPYYWDYFPYGYTTRRPILYNTFYIAANHYRPHYRISPVVRLNFSRNTYISRRGNNGYRQNFHNQNFNRNVSRAQGRSFNTNRVATSRMSGGTRRGHR